jgi:hypothetical protein
MKQAKQNIILILSILTLSSSCELETNWNFQAAEPVVIVDAIITNENKAQVISIYYSSSQLNDTSLPLSGANVLINDGINSFPFNESPSTPGLYLSDPFIAATNVKYALIISYENKADTAYATMVPISPFNEYSFEQKDSLLKYNDTGSELPAMTEVYYNWSDNPTYCAEYGSCMASQTFYSLNIVDMSKEFAHLLNPKQVIQFPSGTLVSRKKYSLSEEHQNFIRSLLIETEWRGGLFDVEQGNIPTNFVNGTKGWFGVCQVLSDSTIAL